MAGRRTLLLLTLVIGCGGGGGGSDGAAPDGGADATITPDAPSGDAMAAPDAAAGEAAAPDADVDSTGAEAGAPDGPTAARLVIDRTDREFGTRVRDCTEGTPIAFHISNAGGAASGPLAVQIDKPFATKNDQCGGRSLAAGESCEVGVLFRPEVDGMARGTLTVTASPGGEVRATLTGTGVHGDNLEVGPNPLDFGGVYVGTISPGKSLTVRNVGSMPLNIETVTIIDGDFRLRLNRCYKSQLAPGADCQLDIEFAPYTGGAKTSVISVHATGCAPADATVMLTGVGLL